MTTPRKPASKRGSTSEFRAHPLIVAALERLGWDRRQPKAGGPGQVYTQNECLAEPGIAAALHLDRPEYVVRINDGCVWVIEAKTMNAGIDLAVKEALEYAQAINGLGQIRAAFYTGFAGDDNKFEIVTGFINKAGRAAEVTYHGEPVRAFLTPEQVRTLLATNKHELDSIDVSEELLSQVGESINHILHAADVKKDLRAEYVTTLLLAMSENPEGIVASQSPTAFVQNINTMAEDALTKRGKEHFARYLRINIPEGEAAREKLKTCLVSIVRELLIINVAQVMRSGLDVLGKFYEAFLRYGNGAKDMGIVFTPRHITEFAADIVSVGADDLIFDPTCGTGGFLISAWERVRRSKESKARQDMFREHHIFGVETNASIAALAIANMIFRNDGRSHIENDDCFARQLVARRAGSIASGTFVKEAEEGEARPITKVLMNPPFYKKGRPKEYVFVDHALAQMAPEGVLFAVVPYSVLTREGIDGKWRQDVLRDNTLVAVISLPPDLFSEQANTVTAAIVLRRGVKHDPSQPVFWARAVTDGMVVVKKRRFTDPRQSDTVSKVKDPLRRWIVNGMTCEDVPEFIAISPLNPNDPVHEWAPEAYLAEAAMEADQHGRQLELMVRETSAFLERHRSRPASPIAVPEQVAEIKVVDLFASVGTGEFHDLSSLTAGTVPVVSCTTMDNGIAGFYDISDKRFLFRDAVTIASNGAPLASFYHPYTFAAKDDVLVGKMPEGTPLATTLYVVAALNRLRWRFSYGRKCYRNKLSELKVRMPVLADGTIDHEAIAALWSRVTFGDRMVRDLLDEPTVEPFSASGSDETAEDAAEE